jgi:hypothetical protein
MRIAALLLVAAAVLALYGAYRFLRRQEAAMLASRRPPGSDAIVRLENARIVSRTAGQLEWKLLAREIVVRHGGGDLQAFRSVALDRIRDGVIYSKGKPQATFSAGSAEFDRNGKTLQAKGGIEVCGPKGEILTSASCLLSENDDFVRFPEGATFADGRSRIHSPSLLFAPRRRLVQCPSGAEGTVNGFELRAASLYWDVEAKQLSCPGSVTGVRKGQPFSAESIEVDLKTNRLVANRGWIRLRMESGAG